MKERHIKNGVFMLAVLMAAFLINVFTASLLDTQIRMPMVFVLGIIIVALKTDGYIWGVVTSVLSVLTVRYVFIEPYLSFKAFNPNGVLSMVIVLIITVLVSTLTTKLKEQDRFRREGEKEKMRANLLRAISHDLRTPLTSIYGSTSVIIENYDSLNKEQQIRFLEEIQEDAAWLIRMVENLLSVTRIDDGKVQVQKTPTVLDELIDAVIMKFHKRHPDHEVLVTTPDEFVSIPMDALLIQQVLINLLDNAVYHAKNMTELSLDVVKKGNTAEFTVADNGCGIQTERLEGLFNGGLSSAEASSDGKRSNMGIGLSVCAAIVQAHGGMIKAENRKEGGVVFRFSLEVEVSDEQ